ncbi:hypothetical protein KIW84_033091 [Lathyrus oleraceus]|uniref:Uncharacterized protein n=1 Tax=Pisum sativum TaxID=3888 RepID=A0A9D4XUV5_PEA|nr:hypothetical protein KIW84_033091 [Pisum sativum]
MTTGLRDLVDFLPASIAAIIDYFSSEVTRGVWRLVPMNGTDWPSPTAVLQSVESEIKAILTHVGVAVPNCSSGDSPVMLPLPMAALVSLSITFKLDKSLEYIHAITGVALENCASGFPWPSMPVIGSLWAQKVRRWHNFIVVSGSRSVFRHNNESVAQLVDDSNCHISEMLTSKTSVKEILNDKFVDPAKGIDSICTSSPGNRMSNVFSKAFQELCGHLNDVVDEEEFGDMPPGFEKNSQIIFPPYNSKFQPSRIVECNPKITEYVAVALCRQKLHDEVLEKWKLSILDSTFKQQIHSSTSENAMNLSSDVHVLPEAPVPDTEIKPNDLPSHNGFKHVYAAIPAPFAC